MGRKMGRKASKRSKSGKTIRKIKRKTKKMIRSLTSGVKKMSSRIKKSIRRNLTRGKKRKYLSNTRSSSSEPKTKRKGAKRKGSKKKGKNEYFKIMNAARKKGLDSFEYNGKKYYKKIAKTGMVLYSSKKSKTVGGGGLLPSFQWGKKKKAARPAIAGRVQNLRRKRAERAGNYGSD